MSSETRIINLRVSSKKAYVWDVDDMAYLRAQHHVCGVLSGTLPHMSQQNVFLGMPLVLLPEEVVLLVTIGAAVLVDDPAAHLQPSRDQLAQWSKEQETLAKAQQAAPDVKSPKADRALSEEAIRKRKEREEKRRAAQLAAGVDPLEPTPTPAPDNTTVAQHTIVIPAASDSLAWYDPNYKAYSSLEEAKGAGIWDFPSNLAERARCGVFHDLWKKGFFMGSGIKFGGEFLVYPGDPLRYHSHFTASVIDSPQSALRPMEIVAHGRLGTATKKSHLLCGWDDDKKEVSYVSIEWAGFG